MWLFFDPARTPGMRIGGSAPESSNLIDIATDEDPSVAPPSCRQNAATEAASPVNPGELLFGRQ
jgi:hypothetical protein